VRDYEAKLSASAVDALELRVQNYPDDLKSREILITYYTLKAVKSKRLQHALWLIRNHPEAVIDCPDARLSEQDSPLDSMAAFDEAKTLWLSYADSRTRDARVLMSAAGFISQFDPNLSERLLLQGQQLDPGDHEWILAWSDLYGKAIFTDGRFRPQTPPSPARHNFALRARLVLAASKDASIVGLAGLRLAPQDVEILRTRSQQDTQLGEKLLRRAHELAPADPQWTIYLHQYELAKQNMAEGEQPSPDFGSAPPGTLVKRVKAEYPESAKIRGVTGVVRLKILVGTTGRVIVVRPEDGPMELQAAAAEAVKQWIYKPFEVGGSPVEGWTEVAVEFP
jgi:TonB family protein